MCVFLKQLLPRDGCLQGWTGVQSHTGLVEPIHALIDDGVNVGISGGRTLSTPARSSSRTGGPDKQGTSDAGSMGCGCEVR